MKKFHVELDKEKSIWLLYAVGRCSAMADQILKEDPKYGRTADYKIAKGLDNYLKDEALYKNGCFSGVLDRRELKWLKELANAKLLRIMTKVIPKYEDRIGQTEGKERAHYFKYLGQCKDTAQTTKEMINLIEEYV